MDTLILLIIALGLAMDCFTISISNSSVSGLVKPGVPLKVALVFTLSHILFMMAGYWLGEVVRPRFAGIEAWVAFAVLGIIGLKMIMEARRRHPGTKVFDINQPSVMVILSLATAMDAFLAGVAIGVVEMRLWSAALLVGVTVFILSLGGMAGGKQLGIAYARRTAYFGGAFLLMAAAIFLMRMMGGGF